MASSVPSSVAIFNKSKNLSSVSWTREGPRWTFYILHSSATAKQGAYISIEIISLYLNSHTYKHYKGAKFIELLRRNLSSNGYHNNHNNSNNTSP